MTSRESQEEAAGKVLDFLFRCPSAFYNEERARTYDMLPSNPPKVPSNPLEIPLIPSEIPHGSFILALRNLRLLNGYGKPTYAFEDTLFEDEQRCRVSIATTKGICKIGYGTRFRTKRNAKKDAAMAMFLELSKLAEEMAAREKADERVGSSVGVVRESGYVSE